MIVLDQVMFKAPGSIFGREERCCGITGVARTRTVKLFQNGKKIIVDSFLQATFNFKKLILGMGSPAIIPEAVSFRRLHSAAPDLFLHYFFYLRFFTPLDTLGTEFRCRMLPEMCHGNLLTA